jgi:hypothetical protein
VSKIAKISIITASTIIVIALVYYGLNKKNKATKKKKGILLLGGLDSRSGDKKIDEQVELVKKGITENIDVKGYRYNDLDGILNAISQNPDYNIMLFSAGASKSKEVSQKVKEVGGSLDNIYIIEPYHKGGTATKSVRKAVEMGVPEKNVITGTYDSVGKGIVENSTLTPKCSPSHWCSLTEVAKLV